MDVCSDSQEPPTRVVLWSHPRSRSTVFELAIASDKRIRVIHEPFATAYSLGEEQHMKPRLSTTRPTIPGYKYVDVQTMLEKPFPGKTAVFVKDMFFGGRDRYRYIPRGYVNTFLVRDPRASILSAFRAGNGVTTPSPDLDTMVSWCINTCGLGKMYDLYRHVTEELKERPIVVDSEDLANYPRETLQKYCQATGLPFSESFLKWEPGNFGHFPYSSADSETPRLFFKEAAESSCFKPSSDSDVDLTELPEKLRRFVDECTPFYEEMVSKKL